MDRPKYPPEEIERMINEEIIRIETANAPSAEAIVASPEKRLTSLRRLFTLVLPGRAKRH